MNTTPESSPHNRYDPNRMADEYSAFVERYPSFNQTLVLDEWRQTQYSRLDTSGQIYLDYTGGGLYSESQLAEHLELLRTSVLGNPHSSAKHTRLRLAAGTFSPSTITTRLMAFVNLPGPKGRR